MRSGSVGCEGGGAQAEGAGGEGFAADAAVAAEGFECAGGQDLVHPGAGVGGAVCLEGDRPGTAVEGESGPWDAVAGFVQPRGQLVYGEAAEGDVAAREVRVRGSREAEVAGELVEDSKRRRP